MERVLNIYEQPYDQNRPVICFDERPCQLIGDCLQPISMEPGKVQRQDYHYQRNGTCCVLMAVEPLAGRRIDKVTERKTKKDYVEFMKQIERTYAKAEKIILVQDNLNTHNPSSFYETFPAKKAFELSQSFDMVYTPTKASWQNMAEIELSALSKQCLDWRISNLRILSNEISAWSKNRNIKKETISWQFTKNVARKKLNRHYGTIKN